MNGGPRQATGPSPRREVGGAPRRVVIVGGGIAGLAAAWELSAARSGGPGASVVLLEREARFGGKVSTAPFAGRPVDRAADGFLGRRPEAVELCRQLGLEDELEPIGAAGAAVWVGRRRRPLPKNLALGVPTRFWPAARSQLLGPKGTVALLRDLLVPRRDLRGPLGDRAVGPLVAQKLGSRVVERMVEPLLGGIYAGGVADMSAAATFPALLEAAEQRGSLMRALRRVTEGASASAGAGPAFWSLRRGLGSLPDRLTERLGELGVDLRPSCAATALERRGRGWLVRTAGEELTADGVVLALPAYSAAELLAPLEPEAARVLRSIEYASVAVVTASYRSEQLPEALPGTGLLVPRRSRGPAGSPGEGPGELLVTACTYLSSKWPHLSRAGELLVRASAGRLGDERAQALDDDELARRVESELAFLLGLEGAPSALSVDRWPDALPQYRVHHGMRMAAVEAALERLGGIVLAGAAYHGVGIPACVASGRRAAGRLLGQPENAPEAVPRQEPEGERSPAG